MYDVSKLLELMAQKGISQRAMARALGITYKSFHYKVLRSMSGNHSFYVEELLKMAEVLGMKPEDILFHRNTHGNQ